MRSTSSPSTASAAAAAAAEAAGRAPDEVTVVAVTKTHGPELVRQAVAAAERRSRQLAANSGNGGRER